MFIKLWVRNCCRTFLYTINMCTSNYKMTMDGKCFIQVYSLISVTALPCFVLSPSLLEKEFTIRRQRKFYWADQ